LRHLHGDVAAGVVTSASGGVDDVADNGGDVDVAADGEVTLTTAETPAETINEHLTTDSNERKGSTELLYNVSITELRRVDDYNSQ